MAIKLKLKLQLVGIGAYLSVGFLAALFLYIPPVASAADIGGACVGQTAENCLSSRPFMRDINNVIKVLSAMVGVVVVGVIILGGIQYSAAGDNPQAIGAAKKRIINGLLALVAFLLTASFLQWIIPGGLFNT
jgi:hypothetical protein